MCWSIPCDEKKLDFDMRTRKEVIYKEKKWFLFFFRKIQTHRNFLNQIFGGFYLRNRIVIHKIWCVFADARKKIIESNKILMLKNHHHRIVKKKYLKKIIQKTISDRISHWTDNEQSLCILNEIHEFQAKSTVKGELVYEFWKKKESYTPYITYAIARSFAVHMVKSK